MIFRLFITGFVLCVHLLTQAVEKIAYNREDVADAVNNFLESRKNQKNEMVQQLLKLPKEQLIQLLRQYDEMPKEDLEGDFGFDKIVLEVWYNTVKGSVFDNEKERKNFEEAVSNGKLVGFNDNTDNDKTEFSVIEIENALYFVPIAPSTAELVAMKFIQALEDETGKFSITQEEEETDKEFEARKSEEQKHFEKQMNEAKKKAEEAKKTKDKKKAEKLIAEAQKIAEKAQEEFGKHAEKALNTACNVCLEEFKSNFLYGMLVFRVFSKASKPIIVEAINVVKEKFRKK